MMTAITHHAEIRNTEMAIRTAGMLMYMAVFFLLYSANSKATANNIVANGPSKTKRRILTSS